MPKAGTACQGRSTKRCCQQIDLSASVTHALSALVFTRHPTGRGEMPAPPVPRTLGSIRELIGQDLAMLIILGQPPRVVEHTDGPVRMTTHFHLGLDVVIAMPVGNCNIWPPSRTQLSLPTVHSSCSHRMSSKTTKAGHGTKAAPASLDGWANSTLNAGRYTFWIAPPGGSIGQSQFFRQPALVRLKRPFHPPAGLR